MNTCPREYNNKNTKYNKKETNDNNNKHKITVKNSIIWANVFWMQSGSAEIRKIGVIKVR